MPQPEYPAYLGDGMAVHVELDRGSPTPVGPDSPGPVYQGRAPTITSTILSPDQFTSPPPGPMSDVAIYYGVSQAIHVFGDADPEFPDPGPIPSCESSAWTMIDNFDVRTTCDAEDFGIADNDRAEGRTWSNGGGA